MENTIDFFFNPLFKEGTEFVLQNVRNVYSSDISRIFVWVDDDYIIKNEIIDISRKHQATAIASSGKFTWCNPGNKEESKLRLLEFLKRMKKTAELSNATWILYLEDDVLVKNKIVNFPDTKLGINPGDVASGGSIYDRKSILEVFSKYTDEALLNIMDTFPYHFAADRLMLKLYSDCNIEYSKFADLADGVNPDNTTKPIIHNVKTHYPSYWKEYRKYLNGENINNPLV